MENRLNYSYSIGYVLSYYAPGYVRAHTQQEGLRKLPHATVFEARNHLTNPLRYLETLAKLLLLRVRRNPDIYILGFRGVELFWPVRLLTLGRPLVLDQMMSPYDSLVNERKRLRPKSLLARLVYQLEQSAVRASGAVLTDTTRHCDYFSELYGIPRAKFHAVSTGSYESAELFETDSSQGISTDGPLQVLFFGTFLPNHGVDVILDTAYLASDLPVQFVLLGGKGKELSEIEYQKEKLALTNVEHILWVEPERIPEYIARADLLLGGPFGDSGQARRALAGKVLRALASAKATVVGFQDMDLGFVDRENCLLVNQRDPEALAAAIRWAVNHRDQLPAIGQAGYQLYYERFSSAVIGQTLDTILTDLLIRQA